MDSKKRKLILHFALLALTAMSARFLLLYAIGPQSLPDTAQYLEVSRNLAETGTFTILDPATGKLAPFAMRVPLFHVFTAAIIKVSGPDCGRLFAIFNILLSVAIALLTAFLFRALAGAFTGLLAGYFMALNPNAVYNSVLILPDTLFSLVLLLTAAAGLKALRSRGAGWYLGWGVLAGLTALVKPVFKYYWAIPLLILSGERLLREKAARKAAVFVLGFALVVSPWLARNYAQLAFPGFELTFGVNTIWSTIDLIKTSREAKVKKDPALAAVRDIVAASKDPMAAMENVKEKLQLTDVEVNSYLAKLGKEVALNNPAEFSRRYFKNAVNFLTSPSSALELYYKASSQGENNRMQIKEAAAAGRWGTVLVNLAARAAGLAAFLMALYGLLLLARRDRPAALLLLSLIAYFTLISSFTAGYDRYRLPIDPLLAGLSALSLSEYFKRLFRTAVPPAPARSAPL